MAEDWQPVDDWEPVAAPTALPEAPTLQQRGQQLYGFDPELERGTIMPVGKRPGEKYWSQWAWPQIAVDIAESGLLPGHVAAGGQYTPEDVTRFAMDVAGMRRGIGTTPKSPATAARMTRREFVRGAPSREALQRQSRKLFRQLRERGIRTTPESFEKGMSTIQGALAREKVNRVLHPKAVGILREWGRRTGQEMDIDDLMIMRREAATVAKSLEPDERRIGSMMVDMVDDYFDNLQPDDLVAGAKTGAAVMWRRARQLWHRQSKMADLEQMDWNAQVTASGYENGLRIEARKLLRSPKRMRGWTKDEIKAIKRVAEGGPIANFSRLLGKFGFGGRGASGMLGGTIGTGAGATLGGPAGAVAVPAAGAMAQEIAAGATARAMERAGATVARGGVRPPLQTLSRRAAGRLGGPLVGTQIQPGIIYEGREYF